MADPNPTLARRRLAVRLRTLRERDGRSLTDLAEYLSVSLAQASRLDTGARGFKGSHIDKLADWYAVSGPERDLLADLADESQKRAWWQQIELPDSYRTLIGMEQGAEVISEYCGLAIPGLLQTAEYARAVAAAGLLDPRDDLVARAAEVRARRQSILARGRPPYLQVVIDEAVLARATGGEVVMTEQLDYLLDLARRPRIALQVVGFEAGSHLGVQYAQFILLGMADAVPDVLYTEESLTPLDTDDLDSVATYRRDWDMLRASALDQKSTVRRIQTYRLALTSAR